MPLVKWAFIGLLALPLAEIGAFLLVASAIGWFWAFALFVATSVIGVMLLRRSGLDHLKRLRAAVSREGIAAVHLDTPGLAAVVGGILLVFPGFITDLLGLALFVPPLRRWAGATAGRALRERRRKTNEPSVIDLGPEDWHQISDATDKSRATKRRRRAPRRYP